MTSQNWKQIKTIAIEAWARPAAERIAYVTHACADDETLRGEVLSLVESMEAAEDRFETPPPLPADDVLTPSSLNGRRVGPYEILSRIGAGGMGEVYKARDTRLGRAVAIKVLRASATTDPASRERMEREARAVAALNHPHICAIYDIGREDGVDYFVMELVDGETLATRLSRGVLPIAEALRYAEQIASALGEAHRAGIVHRDVKPANIMLHAAADGAIQAKLLDFGVAKANAPEMTSTVERWQSDTAADLTIAGVIVGTPYYMAPEQLDHNAADRRTDIFAFGAVLFETVTGRRAFEGRNRDEVLAAIRAGNVPLTSKLRGGAPAVLDRIVRRCLTPDPGERYQSAYQLLGELRTAQRRVDSSRWRTITAGALVLVLALIGVIAWSISTARKSTHPGIEPSLMRLTASAGVLGAPALSPDGSNLIFSWAGEGLDNLELMLLPIGSTTRRQLTNDPGNEEWPAWSPDGREVAFIRCGSATCGIFALRLDEGSQRKIRDLRLDRYYGLAWSPDGRSIVYGERPSDSEPYGLFELSLHDSAIRRLTVPPSGSGDLRFALSPDGRTLAVIRLNERGIGVHLVALDTRTERTLLQDQNEWFGGIAWSADGRHLIVSANQQGVRRLWRLPAAGGRLVQLVIAGEDAYYPSVQGSRLIFVRSFRDWDFSRMTVSNGRLQAASPFPSSTRLDLDPAFSPDGRKLAFVSERSGTREVWVSNADGSKASQLTSLGGPFAGRPSWSPDGQQIAFHAAGINVIPAHGGPIHRLSDDGEVPTWSADGQSIYFIRTRGKFSLWKVPVAGGAPEQVLTSEVAVAREAAHNRDLYFTRPDGLWRLSPGGAQETRVIPDFTWVLPGYWTVVNNGIYYVVRTSLPDNTLVHQLKFYDFARSQATDLGVLTGTIDEWVGGLTISSDRRTVVYSQRTYQSNEIMLVEHFR